MVKDIIIMFGSTEAGKTTHAHGMLNWLDATLISSGEIARSLMDKETSDRFKEGQLSPHEDEIRSAIYKKIVDARNTVILDGFPRVEDQYEDLYAHFKDCRIYGIYLDCSDSVLANRWVNRSRDEFDTLYAAACRHKLFLDKTVPMMKKMLMVGHDIVFVRVDREMPISEVQTIIRHEMSKFMQGVLVKKNVLEEAIDHFVMHHHVQSWGDPVQATTYALTPDDLRDKLRTIARAAERSLVDAFGKPIDVVSK